MFAGIDFPSKFEQDNFAQRRSPVYAAGVAYDPESLFTEAELRELERVTGNRYAPSKRNWPGETEYLAAVAGLLPTEDILSIAPRVAFPAPTVPVARQQAVLGPWGPE